MGEEILSEEGRALVEEFRKNKGKTLSNSELSGASTTADIIQQAKELEEKYDYTGAISLLEKAKAEVSDKKMSAEILSKLAQNYIKINDFEAALRNFLNASNALKDTGDKAGCAKVKLKTANLYKNLYRFEKAKECIAEITDNRDDAGIDIPKNTVAKGFLELGEIYEMENDFKSALKNYENAASASDLDNPDYELLSEIYFKTALLYDDGQNTEKALEYYKKSIEEAKKASSESENKFLSTCFANMGLIYAEKWSESAGNTDNETNFNQSVENFETALEIDKKEQNQNGIYFASRQLSMLYRDVEAKKSAEFLQIALNAAVALNDNFKTALSHLELGDYYYNIMDNRHALISYFEAGKALGSGISNENKERISIRINDMKIKMDENEFREIADKYLKNQAE